MPSKKPKLTCCSLSSSKLLSYKRTDGFVKTNSHFRCLQTLFKLLERGAHVPVRVQGPIGLRHAEYPWMKYNVLVCIVGGIGVRFFVH